MGEVGLKTVSGSASASVIDSARGRVALLRTRLRRRTPKRGVWSTSSEGGYSAKSHVSVESSSFRASC